MREKQADGVSILLMNPQNGEILSMVNVPEFNLNDPFELNTGEELEGEKIAGCVKCNVEKSMYQ